MSDYEDLKKAAEASIAFGYSTPVPYDEDRPYRAPELAWLYFLNLAKPEFVLTMIAENERLARRDQMLAEVGCEYCGGGGHVSRIDGEYLGVCDQCPAYELNCTKHERDQLKSELECARGDIRTGDQIIERLKKDAERYRWLRSDAQGKVITLDGRIDDHIECLDHLSADELDALIDAEISEESI